MFDHLFSRSGLSLDRLRGFLAFAEAGSIARAAPNDLSRQSQLSRQIGELEAYFGAELTHRRGKSLMLTTAGKRLAVLIREQLQDLEDFHREQNDTPKAFTLGSGASIIDWLVIPVQQRIRAALEGATLRLETHRSQAMAEAVRDGRIDLAVLRKDVVPSGLKSLPLCHLSFHLCIPRKLMKPEQEKSAATSAALWQTLPFAAGRDGGQVDTAIRQAMQSAGVRFSPLVECNSMLQVRQLIERGECAGILPSLGSRGLAASKVFVTDFAPMKSHGRQLTLTYNARQMRRRGVEDATLKDIARVLKESASG
jgi:DNA-binding transcriptional LysR family regulator